MGWEQLAQVSAGLGMTEHLISHANRVNIGEWADQTAIGYRATLLEISWG
jgi:hypothetical protein